MNKLHCFGFTITVALFLAPILNAALDISSGTVSTGVDFASGTLTEYINNVPPSGRTPSNAFNSSADLLQTPYGGSAGLSANGWAGVTWQVAGGTNGLIKADGSSHQGYNGFVGPSGYLYGWGHSAFDTTITLDQDYAYVANTPTSHVSGLWGSTGYLRAGTYRISGATDGNSGGFSINASLFPTASSNLPTPEQVLNSLTLSPALVDSYTDPATGKQRERISFTISSSLGINIGNAAQLLGVDHFNFLQYITHVPDAWEIVENGTVIKHAGDTLNSPLLDPMLNNGIRLETDPRIGVTIRINYKEGLSTDSNESYYDDASLVRANAHNGASLRFSDSPSRDGNMFQPGEYMRFETQLVGVDQDGKLVQSYGLGYAWSSDQTDDGGGIWGYDSTSVEEGGLPGRVSGGIFDVSQVPEPSTLMFGAIGISGILLRRRRDERSAEP